MADILSLTAPRAKAGCYTPESSVEHPAAVEALAEEFSWAGADITQTFTYYSRDVGTPEDCSLTVSETQRGAVTSDNVLTVSRDQPGQL